MAAREGFHEAAEAAETALDRALCLAASPDDCGHLADLLEAFLGRAESRAVELDDEQAEDES